MFQCQLPDTAALIIPLNMKIRYLLAALTACLVAHVTVEGSSSPQIEILPPLAVLRTSHDSLALKDGRILITGGRDSLGQVTAAAEIFDPATRRSTAIASMQSPRVNHSATLLGDGRVLIAGGFDDKAALDSAEVFDPTLPENGFRLLTDPMHAARARHTATLLNSGKVLLAGGDLAGSAELFDPAIETFAVTLHALAVSRAGHSATLFSDDSVLLAGGGSDSLEVFTPAEESFSLAPDRMAALRTGQETLSLSDTRLLFVGGDVNHTIEEFDLSGGVSTVKGSMALEASSATLLANGKVLLLRSDIAGIYDPNESDPALAFTAFNETSIPGSDLLRRDGQTATLLAGDQKILISGGMTASNEFVPQLTLFNPARIWTDKDDYMPEDPVLLFGSGWRPNENVYLYAVDSETEAWTYESTAAADAAGSFAIEPYFIVQLRHLGTLFTVNAVGAQSKMQAEVEFTDAINLTGLVVGSQSGSAVAGTASSLTYSVVGNYNNGGGSNPDDPVTLSLLNWAAGTPSAVSGTVTATFSPATISVGAPSSTLKLQTTSSTTSAGSFTFTVRATTKGGQTKDATGTLTIGPASATKYLVTSSDNNPIAGSAVTITAQLADANGNPVATAGKTVTWSKTGAGGSFQTATSTTNASGVATVSFTTANTVGTTYTITATDNSSFTGTSSNITTKTGTATNYIVTASDSNPDAGTAVTVSAQLSDVNGNPVSTAGKSVTWTKSNPNGSFASTTSTTNGSGIATVSFTTGTAAGTIYTVTATDNTNLTGTSGSITTKVGAASKVVLSGSTADLTSGATKSLTATIQDASGNTVTTGPNSTASITFAKTAGAGNVSGLAAVAASAGVANITVTGTTAGSVTITASSGTLATGSGNPIAFNVVSATLHHFGISAVGTQTAGTAFSIAITAQDLNDNTVTSYSGGSNKVKLTSTGALVGAPVTSGSFTNGVLTSQSVTITNTGNFTITATDNGGGTATGTSNSFQVNAGAASKLVFTQQPTTTAAGQTISAVKVQVQDANGNATTSTASIAMAIANNPSSGTLSGTTPVTAANGTATFSDLSINKGGTGYTLQATSAGLTSATSTSFNVTNPSPTLTSIAPTSGNISQTLDVVFNGSNYIQGVSSVNFGANITVNSVTVNSGIKLTANITIGAGATIGTRNVSVSNSTPGGGTSATQSFTVNSPTTTTAVTSSLNPSTYGGSVTFTATVASAGGTPTGTVTFYDGTCATGDALSSSLTLDASGKASFSTASLSAGSHTITACYSPTGIYLASNGNVVQTVNKAHLKVAADDKTRAYGAANPVFTATITGFVNGDTATVVSGTASFSGAGPSSTASSPVGSNYVITPAVGTLSAANYDFTPFVDGKLTITKAHLTVTADDKTRAYGAANPSFTANYSGFVNGDTAAVVSGSASFSGTGPSSTASSQVGSNYVITPAVGTLTATNYDFGPFVDGKLTITKAHLTVTADDKTRAYGATNPAFTAKITGFVNGDTNAVVSGSADFTGSGPASTATTAAGDYVITPTIGTLAATNYDFTPFLDGTLNITKAHLKVTADDKSRTYGSANPAFTASFTGFVNGDTVAVVDGSAAFSGAGPASIATTAAGDYAIVVSVGTLSATNYDFTPFVNGTLTIDKRTVTVTADAKTKNYGDNNPALTATVTGAVNGDELNYSLATTAVQFSDVGSYPITVTLGSNPNYDVTATSGSLTVNARIATIAAEDKSKSYGDLNPALTAIVTGTVNGDELNYSLSTSAVQFSNAGNYTIMVSLGLNPNYSITPKDGTLVINRREATIAADPKNKSYGDANPALSATVTGTVNGDTLHYTLGTTALQFSDVGGYPITVTLGSNPNYDVTITNSTLTINRRVATITANDKTKTYGDANPALTATITGTVNGDTLNYSLTTAALQFSNVGDYTIVVNLGVNPNYSITPTDGVLSINPRQATITANNKTKTYGDANPVLTAAVNGTVNGDALNYSLSTAALQFSNVGDYDIVVNLGVNPNYNITPTDGVLTINPRVATITASNKTKTYGDVNPALTATVAGTVNGDTLNYTLATTAGQFSGVGSYPITITLGSNLNYSVTPTNGVLAINARPASITAENKNKTYGDQNPALTAIVAGTVNGDVLNYSLTTTASQFSNVGSYAVAVNLGLNPNYSITATAGSLTIDPRPATVTANDKNKTYGDVNPTLNATIAGTVNGDLLNYTLATAAGQFSDVGDYVISITLGSNPNYSVTSYPGTLKISKRAATLKADDKSKTYGDNNPAFTATIAGTVNSDALDYTLSTAAVKFSNTGSYPITVTLGSNPNYSITPTNGTLVIIKAHLAVTADAKSKVYNAGGFSAFSATLSGFLGTETDAGLRSSGALSGTAGFSGSATTAVNAGSYTITPTSGTLSATNYDFTPFVNGTLTISKADAIVNVSGYAGTYDGYAHGATGSFSGVDAGGAALGGSLSLGSNFTNYSGGIAHWVFTGGANYNDKSGDVDIVISKAHLTVTADNKSRLYGQANPIFTATISGFVHNETLASSGVTGSAQFTGSGPSSIATDTVGNYVIIPTSGTLAANNYDFPVTNFVNGTLTIGKAHLTVTADPKSPQYSDPALFTATITGFANNETDASLRTAGALLGMPSFTTTATVTNGNVLSGPGSYTITPALGTLSATNYDFPSGCFKTGALTVTAEDARAYYTGLLYTTTSSATSSAATVTLSATVKDITAETTDSAYDQYAGDIRNATITFVQWNGAVSTPISPALPIGLVSSGDAKVGTATFNWNVNINGDEQEFTIGVVVNGYYTRNNSTECTVVTVAKPIPGSINGGGYLVEQKSSGLVPGGVGTKNNFGFNVKNASNSPKGTINTIIRNNGRVYQIKGNAMTSLTTKVSTNPATTPSTATFNGKANIQDITNPLAPLSVDGNATLQVVMSDRGEPGGADSIAITVWNKSGGLWFSSSWNGTQTIEQSLGGGNLQVR